MFIGGPDGPTPVGCVILVIAVTKASNWVIRLSTSTDQLGVANLISFLDTNTNSSDLALKINLSELITTCGFVYDVNGLVCCPILRCANFKLFIFWVDDK